MSGKHSEELNCGGEALSAKVGREVQQGQSHSRFFTFGSGMCVCVCVCMQLIKLRSLNNIHIAITINISIEAQYNTLEVSYDASLSYVAV